MQLNEEGLKASPDRDRAAYEAQRGDLEFESFGKWVLFRDGQLVNVYDNYEAAASNAERRFRQEPYLIHQIGEALMTVPDSELPVDREKKSKWAVAKPYLIGGIFSLVVVVLWLVDRIIDLMPLGFDLWRRLSNRDNRRIAPTKRIPWEKGQKDRLIRRQRSLCAYCGRYFAAHYLEIDHMDPVTFGGSNAETNLQVLCRPCNGRKGDQTDRQFRQRYADLVPRTRLTPPSRPVSQKRFDEITRGTRASAEVRALRGSRYFSTREKIGAGSLVMGFAVFGGVQVGLTQLISWDYWWILSVTLGVLVGGGLYLRAWRTGALHL